MSVEGGALQGLSERVGQIDIRVNLFKDEEILLNPVTQSKILNIHVTGPWVWLLSIGHGSTGVIILIADSSCLLWNVQVPEDTAYVETHFAGIASSHKFGLSGGEGNCGLKLHFICNGATSQTHTKSGKRTTGLHASSPVRI
jgi:hypothetical protein